MIRRASIKLDLFLNLPGCMLSVFSVLLLLFPLLSNALAEEKARIRLATTTSTDNSGLLEYLFPPFEKQTGLKIDVIAVGTGKALKLAERGDVDLVMVHAPEAELAFVKAGWGVNRRSVMVNDFLIVGPPADPARVKLASSLPGALKQLMNFKGTFVSRGDDSGTHKKERKLWPLVGGFPASQYYLETGQGMEATLRIAHEKKAYTLTDRGTFLALGKELDLLPAFEADARLENPYSIIAVNPARHKHVHYLEAMRLIAWLTSTEGQAVIGVFRVGGQILFHPTAIP